MCAFFIIFFQKNMLPVGSGEFLAVDFEM